MNTKTKYHRLLFIPLLLLLTGGLLFSSCTKKDEDTNGNTLIKRYGLVGKYRFMVIPVMMGIQPIAAGPVDGSITTEGNGILRLRFAGFREKPMPFAMNVDAQFTISETSSGLLVKNVDGKTYFDALMPAGGVDPDDDPGFTVPKESLESGIHSNGKSKISGEYKNSTKELALQLDPAVNLPVIVMIRTVKKLD